MARKKDLTRLKRISVLRDGESIRFRDARNKFAKFDGRKKLVAEIWYAGHKTNRTLNKISRGKPVPQRFPSKQVKKRLLTISAKKVGIDKKSEVKSLTIKIDAHHTIADNVEAKADRLLSDIVKNTHNRKATFVTIEFSLFNIEKLQNEEHSIDLVMRGTNKGNLAMEIARYFIRRLYDNKARMSGISSDAYDRTDYVRTIKVRFTWNASNKF